eukprot:1314728-Pyramimonas_sp.AAC.1
MPAGRGFAAYLAQEYYKQPLQAWVQARPGVQLTIERELQCQVVDKRAVVLASSGDIQESLESELSECGGPCQAGLGSAQPGS